VSETDLHDRLRAWDAGAPLPRGHTLSWPRAHDADRLVVAFVRMGGESAPWGVAVGPPDEAPQIFIAAEPRNADEHAAFIAQLGPALLDHLDHPRALTAAAREALLHDDAPLRARVRTRQLWMPGPSHVEMLHFLDYRYTLAKKGDPAQLPLLRQTGRAAGWLFRESTRPGQVRVLDATARLQEAFTFPVEPVRQAHLGHLLAWLESPGDRDARIDAAERAEQLAVGVTLDPRFERDVLQPLLERYHATRDTLAQHIQAAFLVHNALQPELLRRWKLTVRAMRRLDADPRPSNPQLGPVLDLGASEFAFAWWQGEARGLDESLDDEARRAFVTHPETDRSPARAAQRYFSYLHAWELSQAELVHGDPARIEAAVAAGNGFTGVVKAVQAPRGAPVTWTVEAPRDASLRLRAESTVCLAGFPKRTAKVLDLEAEGSLRTITLQFPASRSARAADPWPPGDPRWQGETVTLLESVVSGISLRKARRVHKVEGPGTWLTHATPLPEATPAPPARTDLVAFLRGLEAPSP